MRWFRIELYNTANTYQKYLQPSAGTAGWWNALDIPLFHRWLLDTNDQLGEDKASW